MSKKYSEVISILKKVILDNKEDLIGEPKSRHDIRHRVRKMFMKSIIKMKKSDLKKIISSDIGKRIPASSWHLEYQNALGLVLTEDSKDQKYLYQRKYFFCKEKSVEAIKIKNIKKIWLFIFKYLQSLFLACATITKSLFRFCLKNAKGIFLLTVIGSQRYNGKEIRRDIENAYKRKDIETRNKIKILDKWTISEDLINKSYDNIKDANLRLARQLRMIKTASLVSDPASYFDETIVMDNLIYCKDRYISNDDRYQYYLQFASKIKAHCESLTKKEVINGILNICSSGILESYWHDRYTFKPIVSRNARLLLKELCSYLDIEDIPYIIHLNEYSVKAKIEIIKREKCIWS